MTIYKVINIDELGEFTFTYMTEMWIC